MKIRNNVLLYIERGDIEQGNFIVPNSVTSIDEWVFCGCTGLKSITIPNSLTSIGEGAFRNCTSLKSINIPNSVRSIGEWAFAGCTSLTSVTIPNSVTSIGNYAFYNCTDLKSITIPDSVKWIEGGTFYNCKSLNSVTIPNSVTSIGNFAFSRCTNLSPHNINKSDIIDLAISLLPGYDGLCSCLDEATRAMSIKTHTAISAQSIFPNFKQEIAIEKFGGHNGGYWWPEEDKESRLKFLEYLRTN